MKTKFATDLFDDWAINGKDRGMEEGHSPSVDRMIKIIQEKISKNKSRLSVLDIGCGNGWMLRKVLSIFPNSNLSCNPNFIFTAACTTLFVTKLLPLLGDSWLNKMPLVACSL